MSDTVIDEMIRREVQLQRFATNIVRQSIQPTAQDIAEYVSKAITDYENLNRRDRERLIADIKKYTREKWGGIWVGFSEEIAGVMSDEGEFQADLYSDVTQEGFIPPANVSAASAVMSVNGTASTWDQFTKDNTQAVVRAVNGVVLTGMRDGATVQQMTQQLRGSYNRRTKRYEGGVVTGRMAKSAEALARTGISHHTNAVRDSFAKQNSDVISKRVFFATLDSRTTTICLSNHLKEWAIDDGSYPKLPLHYNERSVYVFKTAGFNPTQQKRPIEVGLSEDGKSDFESVKGTLKAGNWLRRQPRWFVEESLGKKRAQLFLDGKLDIEKMVDVQNRPLTLNELRNTTAGAKAFRKVNKDG